MVDIVLMLLFKTPTLGSGHYLRQGGGGIVKIAPTQNMPPLTQILPPPSATRHTYVC